MAMAMAMVAKDMAMVAKDMDRSKVSQPMKHKLVVVAQPTNDRNGHPLFVCVFVSVFVLVLVFVCVRVANDAASSSSPLHASPRSDPSYVERMAGVSGRDLRVVDRVHEFSSQRTKRTNEARSETQMTLLTKVPIPIVRWSLLLLLWVGPFVFVLFVVSIFLSALLSVETRD